MYVCICMYVLVFDNYVPRDEFYCLHERIVYDNIDNKGT